MLHVSCYTFVLLLNLAHRNRSDFCDFCDAHRGAQKSLAISRKAFQPEFGAYRGLLAQVLKTPSNPQNLRKKEKILEKGTFIFSAPNSGMHQTPVQKRSEFPREGKAMLHCSFFPLPLNPEACIPKLLSGSFRFRQPEESRDIPSIQK